MRDRISVHDVTHTCYPDLIAEAFADSVVQRVDSDRVYGRLRTDLAVEALDLQALPALDIGLARYWYPQYLATVVLAVDRDRTEAEIGSWLDLYEVDEAVALAGPSTEHPYLLAAISYALEGPEFTYKQMSDLFATLQREERLELKQEDAPILICYDFQAARMIREGLRLELILPTEGSVSYLRGLLSKDELAYRPILEDLLLEQGYRLADGRVTGPLAEADLTYFEPLSRAQIDHFNRRLQDSLLVIRRQILHVRTYTSANSIESQLFVFLYMILVVIWTANVLKRAMDRAVRELALMTAVILLMWIGVRLLKWQLGTAGILARYLWYSYYLFQNSLPIVLLHHAIVIDTSRSRQNLPWWFYLFVSYNAVLTILVLTNDLHQLVFRFRPAFENWSGDYQYGFSFYLVVSAWVLPFLVSITLLMIKGWQTPRKQGFVLVLIFALMLMLYGYGYTNRIPVAWESDYTMVVGVFSLFFLEICMRSGLVRVNSNYVQLFTHSPLDMQLLDHDTETALSSATAATPDPSILKQALEIQPLGAEETADSLLYATRITGGYGIWREDIGGLNRLYRRIEESVRKLTVTNAVLSEEGRIRQAIEEEAESRRLMAQLEREISGHLEALTEMIDQLVLLSEPGEEDLIRVALRLVHVKRRCNLFFSERESLRLSASDLRLYVDELAELAELLGVRLLLQTEAIDQIPVRLVSLMYDSIYELFRLATQETCPYILATLEEREEELTLRLLPSGDLGVFSFCDEQEDAIRQAGGHLLTKDLDGALGISLIFSKEGGVPRD